MSTDSKPASERVCAGCGHEAKFSNNGTIPCTKHIHVAQSAFDRSCGCDCTFSESEPRHEFDCGAGDVPASLCCREVVGGYCGRPRDADCHTIGNESLEQFQSDGGLSTIAREQVRQDRERVYCHGCSQASGADRAIYHAPPACESDAAEAGQPAAAQNELPIGMVWTAEAGTSIWIYQDKETDRRVIEIRGLQNSKETVLARAVIERRLRKELAGLVDWDEDKALADLVAAVPPEPAASEPQSAEVPMRCPTWLNGKVQCVNDAGHEHGLHQYDPDEIRRAFPMWSNEEVVAHSFAPWALAASDSPAQPLQEAWEIETAYQIVKFILRALAGFNLPIDAMAQEALADGVQTVLQSRREAAPATTEAAARRAADLGEMLDRALREGRHGPMCDRARCVCWKSEARAHLRDWKEKENK